MNYRKQTAFMFCMMLPLCIRAQESFWTNNYNKTMEGYWGAIESISGTGSSLKQTEAIRRALTHVIKQFHITSILDVPCGDFNWMRHVDLTGCSYVGADIVQPLIEYNNRTYSTVNRVFLHKDVTSDSLPCVDLIICRDLLVHLSTQDIFNALKNFKQSGAKYLLTTTFVGNRREVNQEIESGGWRVLNLEKFPFNFPVPLLIINEQCSEQNGSYSDKSLALWLLDTIDI